jgi:sugar/nucleoside kinase (ribokinase family)
VTGVPPPREFDLIVVGDLLADVVVESGALVRGGDVHGTVRVRPAGSGANAAVWAASRGAHVSLIGRVGDDVLGRLLRDALAGRDVHAELLPAPGARTGAMLIVREAGERSMVADRGANAALSPTDLPNTLAAAAVLVSGYLLFHPGSEAAARVALERAQASVVAVEASSWPMIEEYGADRFLSTTKRATMLLANEREVEALTGSTGDRAVEQLAGSYETVVVKRGASGAVVMSDGAMMTATAPEVAEADPTGAGDAFDGVLLAELARGSDLQAALAEACSAGARAAASLETWPER